MERKNKEHCKFLLKETQASQSKKPDESQIKDNELISKVTLKPKIHQSKWINILKFFCQLVSSFSISCTCMLSLCHICENISNVKWHNKEETKKNLET
jgi:hypothetical protein